MFDHFVGWTELRRAVVLDELTSTAAHLALQSPSFATTLRKQFRSALARIFWTKANFPNRGQRALSFNEIETRSLRMFFVQSEELDENRKKLY